MIFSKPNKLVLVSNPIQDLYFETGTRHYIYIIAMLKMTMHNTLLCLPDCHVHEHNR